MNILVLSKSNGYKQGLLIMMYHSFENWVLHLLLSVRQSKEISAIGSFPVTLPRGIFIISFLSRSSVTDPLFPTWVIN